MTLHVCPEHGQMTEYAHQRRQLEDRECQMCTGVKLVVVSTGNKRKFACPSCGWFPINLRKLRRQVITHALNPLVRQWRKWSFLSFWSFPQPIPLYMSYNILLTNHLA